MLTALGRSGPGRVWSSVLRLPIWLYRNGLGWLVADTTLLLTTRGRKSGKRRLTALGYQYDPQTDTYFVVPGWPETSDWYLNLLCDPQVRVRVGNRKFRAVAKRAPEDLAVALIDEYNRTNPFAARTWRALTGLELDDEETLRDLARRCPPVMLHPDAHAA